MRKKVKIVKGKVAYKHRGILVLEPPKGTKVKKMIYDDTANTTTVYLKRRTHLIEIICSIILIFLLIIKIKNFSFNQKIFYDSYPFYSNKILYLNIENPSINSYIAYCELLTLDYEVVTSKVLDIGDTWLTEEINLEDSYYILRITYELPLSKYIEEFKIQIRYVDD